MDFSYTYKDRNDKVVRHDCVGLYLSEKDFRVRRRKEMKQMPNVHYCEYYELGVHNARVKTIANF